MKLLIVDDHPLFLKGLKSYLQKDQGIVDVLTAKDFVMAYKICEKNNIDIILMDIHLGENCGVALTKKIKTNFPDIKVIGFSAVNDYRIIRNMMDAEASGYVLKDIDLDELKVALNNVQDGQLYFSSSIAHQAYSNLNTNSSASKNSAFRKDLTYREIEILTYIVEQEMGNKEIAEKLFISPRTVETHKRNLIQKLSVKNAIGLAKFYFKNADWLKGNIRESRSLK